MNFLEARAASKRERDGFCFISALPWKTEQMEFSHIRKKSEKAVKQIKARDGSTEELDEENARNSLCA